MMTNELATRASAAGLVSLDDPACEAPSLTGNKAATLSLLRRAGFHVPPGVVVSADVLGAVDGDLPAAVRKALQDVPDQLGPGPWAVRSSSTAEDTEQASFAGQFETVLNVDLGGLEDAVLHCWRSGLSNRVKAYAGDRGTGSMAVLIQPMIAAEAAGVAFTMDPVSGRNRTVIEAVKGLGERLVSGAATPERWTVEEDGSIGAPPSPSALDGEQARAIGDLASRVEEHFGRPQDIEWALEGGSLWLLQARPITTLPSVGPDLIPIPIDVPPGDWTKDDFHQPAPLSPFGRAALSEQVLKVIPLVFAEFGVLVDRVDAALIGGWVYSQMIPVGAPPPGRRGRRGRAGPPPGWLLRILMRLHPAIRRRTTAARQAIESDLPMTVIRRWNDEWRPEHQEDTDRSLTVDLGSMSDQELAGQLDHRMEVVRRPEHVMVAMAYFVLVYELAEVCRELLGWDTAKMLALLQGLSTTSTEPARQLASLAHLARSKPAIVKLLGSIDEATPARLASVDAEFARAFERYVKANGHRAITYDVIDPTLAEMPHRLLRLVGDQLALEFSPDHAAQEAAQRRGQAADEARSLLESHPDAERERFERALARAGEAYPAWEDRVWHTQSIQTALLRYVALETGRRLVDRGQLATVDDVFFLEPQEARSALSDGGDRRETARVRKGQRAWAMANPGPLMYGEMPVGEPPFDLLPRAARLVNKAVMWGFAEFYGRPADARDEAVVVGTPASAGRYTGPARVVMGEHQFSKIQPGDVVVCPMTSPTWSVVFPSMGALVTDSGGILSHPAIIAREHGIPAVVGAGNATAVLNDGQRVTVDGNTGIVELVEGANLLDGPWAPSPELIPIPVEVPPGYWERDAFHEPIPVSPFGKIMITEQIVKVFPAVFAEFGIVIDRADHAFIGGWSYGQMIPLGAPPPGRQGGRSRPSAPPRWLLGILMRLHPAIRQRTSAARQAIESDLPMRVIRRWTDEWRLEHQEDAARALAADLGSMSDQELAAQLDHRLEVVGHAAHLKVAVAYFILVYELVEACRELLAWDTAKMLTLLEGLSISSTEPGRQLAHLAQLARSKPAIRELLATVDETTPARLADENAEFARAFSRYVEANGHRAVRYDVIDPTLAEMPHLLLRLVADQLEREFSPDQVAHEALRRRSQAVDEARSLLASHPEVDRERFERTLAKAREAYPAWEDRVWWTQSVQTALVRYLALEIGRRLVDRGQLPTVDDVFFLEAPEARSALFDGADRRETARVAKGRRAWAMVNPGPIMYGDPPSGEPPFDLLPPPARLVNQAVLWASKSSTWPDATRGAKGGSIVAGTPASSGRYTGTVRVVMGEHQFDKIQAGDVVVCPVTSPVWSVVFPSMGALVTEIGGILSHPAIIAREHGIPAVVGTGNATDILKDGQFVTVDGSAGVIELVDRATWAAGRVPVMKEAQAAVPG
jgi:phosphohistidine swiveling domain-containing protein